MPQEMIQLLEINAFLTIPENIIYKKPHFMTSPIIRMTSSLPLPTHDTKYTKANIQQKQNK